MYYKFKNEEAIQNFNKSWNNAAANLKISKIIGTSIFKAEIDNRGNIIDIEGTDLQKEFQPIFNYDEVEEFLESVTFLESKKSDNDDFNSVKNEMLVIRKNLLDGVSRIDSILNKMENM
ncbi:hypothetical protein HPMBJEAJ_00206 [Aeromonas phage avDM6]|nr:hypothetical protein HPMBJEAJ_00206 [Aeromonas phage avDM6]